LCVVAGIEQEGSNLSGVSGLISWAEIVDPDGDAHDELRGHADREEPLLSDTGTATYNVLYLLPPPSPSPAIHTVHAMTTGIFNSSLSSVLKLCVSLGKLL